MLDVVENICGMLKDVFLKVCEYIVEISVYDKIVLFLYVFGWM